jgi:hypothetical protein
MIIFRMRNVTEKIVEILKIHMVGRWLGAGWALVGRFH